MVREEIRANGNVLAWAAANKKAVVQGLPVGANTHDLDAKWEMHHAHVTGKSRSRKQFTTLPQSAWDLMDVKNPKGSRMCCFECHEVQMHNIIVGEKDLEMLSKLFAGKSFQDRAILLNRIFTSGLHQFFADALTRGTLRHNLVVRPA